MGGYVSGRNNARYEFRNVLAFGKGIEMKPVEPTPANWLGRFVGWFVELVAMDNGDNQTVANTGQCGSLKVATRTRRQARSKEDREKLKLMCYSRGATNKMPWPSSLRAAIGLGLPTFRERKGRQTGRRYKLDPNAVSVYLCQVRA